MEKMIPQGRTLFREKMIRFRKFQFHSFITVELSSLAAYSWVSELCINHPACMAWFQNFEKYCWLMHLSRNYWLNELTKLSLIAAWISKEETRVVFRYDKTIARFLQVWNLSEILFFVQSNQKMISIYRSAFWISLCSDASSILYLPSKSQLLWN